MVTEVGDNPTLFIKTSFNVETSLSVAVEMNFLLYSSTLLIPKIAILRRFQKKC